MDHLFVPFRVDGIDQVDSEEESARAEQHPKDPLRPMASVLRDVPETVEGAVI